MSRTYHPRKVEPKLRALPLHLERGKPTSSKLLQEFLAEQAELDKENREFLEHFSDRQEDWL